MGYSEIKRLEQKGGTRKRASEEFTSEAGGRLWECTDVDPDKENTARGYSQGSLLFVVIGDGV